MGSSCRQRLCCAAGRQPGPGCDAAPKAAYAMLRVRPTTPQPAPTPPPPLAAAAPHASVYMPRCCMPDIRNCPWHSCGFRIINGPGSPLSRWRPYPVPVLPGCVAQSSLATPQRLRACMCVPAHPWSPGYVPVATRQHGWQANVTQKSSGSVLMSGAAYTRADVRVRPSALPQAHRAIPRLFEAYSLFSCAQVPLPLHLLLRRPREPLLEHMQAELNQRGLHRGCRDGRRRLRRLPCLGTVRLDVRDVAARAARPSHRMHA